MSPLSDGYHPLAPGKLATLVTYLEMTAPPDRTRTPVPEGYRLDAVERWSSLDAYRRLYTEIGWPWLWTSRLLISDDELDAKLHAPGTLAFTPMRGDRPMGIVEMDAADPAVVEITFFGLVPDAVGAGVGRWLMDEAIALAFSRPSTRRLWLHTCHFDSPAALPFYQRMGFSPYARAVEVFDDARLIGRLDPGAGPLVPIIRDARRPDGL